jgi:hypothetical protein
MGSLIGVAEDDAYRRTTRSVDELDEAGHRLHQRPYLGRGIRGQLAGPGTFHLALHLGQLRIHRGGVAGLAPDLTEALVRAAERYCITFDTLRNGLPVEVGVETPTTVAMR